MKCANSPFRSTRASMVAVVLFAITVACSSEAIDTPENNAQLVHPNVDGHEELGHLPQQPPPQQLPQQQQPVQVPAAQTPGGLQNQPQMMGMGMGMQAGKPNMQDFYGPEYIASFHQRHPMMGGMGISPMMGGMMGGYPHYLHVATPFPFLPQPYAYEHAWGMGIGMNGQYAPKYYGDYGHRNWHIRGRFGTRPWGTRLGRHYKGSFDPSTPWSHTKWGDGRGRGKGKRDVLNYGENGYGHWRYGFRTRSYRHGYGKPMTGAWRQGWSDYFKPMGRMGFGGRYGWGYHVPFPKAGLYGMGSKFPHPANLGYGPVPQHKHGMRGWQFHKAGRYGWGGGYDGSDLRIDQGKDSDCDGPCQEAMMAQAAAEAEY